MDPRNGPRGGAPSGQLAAAVSATYMGRGQRTMEDQRAKGWYECPISGPASFLDVDLIRQQLWCPNS